MADDVQSTGADSTATATAGTLVAPGADGTAGQAGEPWKPHAWMPQLPGDGKTDIEMKDFTTINDLRLAYKALKAQAVPIPKAPEEYKLPALPEGASKDEALETWFKSAAFKAKIPSEAANILFSEWNDRFAVAKTAAEADIAATREKNGKALSDGFGGAEKFNEAMVLARNVVFTFGDSDYLGKELTSEKIADNPGLIRMLVKIGKAIAPDRIVTGTGSGSPPQTSPLDLIYPSMKDKKADDTSTRVTSKPGFYPSMDKK